MALSVDVLKHLCFAVKFLPANVALFRESLSCGMTTKTKQKKQIKNMIERVVAQRRGKLLVKSSPARGRIE